MFACLKNHGLKTLFANLLQVCFQIISAKAMYLAKSKRTTI